MQSAGRKELKERVCRAIDDKREEIIVIGDKVLRNPELGFREYMTARIVSEKFKELGLKYRDGLALTGVKAIIEGKSKGPAIALLGELDAVVCYGHCHSDPQTGAAHACGHNVQVAVLLGLAMGLVHSKVMEELTGRVVLFAVPSEEYGEIEFKLMLREEKKVGFLGGKSELIRLGEFDDIDMALGVHVLPDLPDKKAEVDYGTTNGFIAKRIRFIGREAHAGAAPDAGINALNAAALALLAIHAQRETFRDKDSVRVHPIITKGGDLVNTVPGDVRIETFVRANNTEAMVDANKKVNRALKGGALAVGAEVEITDLPGYLPKISDRRLGTVIKENLALLMGQENIGENWEHRAHSTDMGDVSHLMPAFTLVIGGVKGQLHTPGFEIVEPETVYISSTKALAMTVIDLLFDGAKLGKEIVAGFQPKTTREKYVDFLSSILEKTN